MQGIHFQENYIQRLPAGLSVEQIIRQLAQPVGCRRAGRP